MADDPEPRDAGSRVRDALRRLADDHDLWMATAGDDNPWLVPLSFHWTGDALLLATLRDTATFRNLSAGGGARVALGDTRDVVMVDGDVELPATLPDDLADTVARVTGHDPRENPAAGYVRVVPRRVQAWRTYAETKGRTIMRDGAWVAPPP